MAKSIKIIGALFLLLGALLCTSFFTIEKINEQEEIIEIATKIEESNYFAILEIPKIYLKKELFPIKDRKNNVNKNILVHELSIFPDNNTSHVILAAHSGNGDISFFKDLYLLELEDEVKLYYQDKIYIYEVFDIEVQDKTGVLYLKEDKENMMSLITCTKGDKDTQTIYYCFLKDTKNIEK